MNDAYMLDLWVSGTQRSARILRTCNGWRVALYQFFGDRDPVTVVWKPTLGEAVSDALRRYSAEEQAWEAEAKAEVEEASRVAQSA